MGFKWPGWRSACQKRGISPVPTDCQWALWETGIWQCLPVSEYSYVLEACKSFDVKSWLHLNSLFQHFQGFACFWGEICSSAISWGDIWTLACLEAWVFAMLCCTEKMHVLAFTVCLCFPFRWTSLGSFGAGLSTVLFPAVIQSQWLQFHPLFSSYLLFFILVASFTQSRRNGYSFCVSGGVGVSLLELGGARDLLGSCGRGAQPDLPAAVLTALIATISLLLSPEEG